MRKMQVLTLAVLFSGASLVACAQQPSDPAANAARGGKSVVSKPSLPNVGVDAKAGTPDANAIAAVKSFNPNIVVERIRAAPMSGFRELIAGGQVIYVSDDGKHVFLAGQGGGLFNVADKSDLSEKAMGSMRVELLKSIPQSERIVFAPANPKYMLTVFTDIECGFCRKMHSEIDQLNKLGIGVEYLAFPRQGLGSQDYTNMISVWCAADRKAALTKAKSTGQVTAKDCQNTVAAQYVVGQRAGLTGTPMVLTADGTMLGGYLPPDVLKQRLDAWAAASGK